MPRAVRGRSDPGKYYMMQDGAVRRRRGGGNPDACQGRLAPLIAPAKLILPPKSEAQDSQSEEFAGGPFRGRAGNFLSSGTASPQMKGECESSPSTSPAPHQRKKSLDSLSSIPELSRDASPSKVRLPEAQDSQGKVSPTVLKLPTKVGLFGQVSKTSDAAQNLPELKKKDMASLKPRDLDDIASKISPK